MTKQLRTVHRVYRNSKPVKGAADIVNVRDLQPPVSHPSINKVLEEIDREVRQAIKDQYGESAYPVFQSYNPVETDEEKGCYCWTCKKEFKVKRVYGIQFTTPKCPEGHAKTTDKSWGRCTECKQGVCWETRTSRGGVECVNHHYKCVKCGATGVEPVD
jgi:hypothetical protein